MYTEIVCFTHVSIQYRGIKRGECQALNLALLVFEKFLGTFISLEPANKFTSVCACVHMYTCEGGCPRDPREGKGRALLCFFSL